MMVSPATAPDIKAAYDVCRDIARREAKNFYYAFRVLPRSKSDAMCAVYAFMRKADDLADDESLPVQQRRDAMAAWTAAWHASKASTSDQVFVAVRDAQQRFQIGDELLDQLIAGTTMDLQETSPGVRHMTVEGAGDFQVHEDFAGLYRYCYLVASVVGLVCIRIFGYTDARAELLAERTGVAFQLTNILRDVREDAERGRVYLPMDDMEAAGASLPELVAATRGDAVSASLLALLGKEIERSREFYKSSEELIPLLSADARPAMRVLVEIYRRLLERIAAAPGAVFERRISVPTSEKVAILAGGAVRSLAARVAGR